MRSRPCHEVLERRLALAAMPFAESSSSELLPATNRDVVVVADFDGDSNLEVLSAATGQMFAWNSETREFEPIGLRFLPLGGDDGASNPIRLRSARAFDGDGDGIEDLFMVSQAGSAGIHSIWFYQNQGDGRFLEPQLVSTFDGSYRGGRLADIDGDRDLDVVRVEDWSENVDGVFSPLKAYPVSHRVLDFADVDQDGDEDGFFYDRQSSMFEFVDISSGERRPLYSSDLHIGPRDIDDLRTLRVFVDVAGEISIVGAIDERLYFANTHPDRWEPSVLNIPDQTEIYRHEFNGLGYRHLADFDGDGDLDLVALVSVDDGSDAVKWFEGLATDYDVDVDGKLSALDIDRFCQGVRADDETFDINADGVVDLLDVSSFSKSLGAAAGDVTLDGVFDSADLVELLQKGKYDGAAEWSEGDWNCDGRFDSSDLVWAFQNGRYRRF
jgi:hypothetical protein